MTGLCKTCKHWMNVCKHGEARGNCPYGEDCTPVGYRGHCMKAVSLHGAPKEPTTMMWGMDSSEYQANVYTLPEFGCVMHEPESGR